MDIDKSLVTALKTGRVTFGANSTINNLKTGKNKLTILSSSCPKKLQDIVKYYSILSKTPVLHYPNSSMQLASVCGKPFNISMLSIRDPGESDIIKLVKSLKDDGGN